jgi:hypothetical protein
MADEKSGPPNKRRRPPTTIELKATEVASAQAAKAEAVDSPDESPRTEATEPGPQPEPEPAAPSAAERPRAGGWRERLDLSGLNARLASLRGRATERVDWRLIGAGGAGAAAMLAVFLALWGFGAFNTRDDLTVMLAARLAMTEQQVRDLANRPPPPGVDQRALAELAARIGAAEQAMGRLSDLDARVGKAEAAAAAPRAAQPDAALTARVTTLEGATREAKSRADAAFELAQKAPAQAPTVAPAELQALASRVAALEQGAKAAQEKIAVNAGADRAGRLAFVAVALRGAVERGAPFAQEFAAVKPLVPDAAALGALEPFAASGVPRTAALARELSQLTGPMLSAAGAVPREGGILDRIQQNAERLVRIRPINEAPGDDAATVVARADVKASHGDLAGALAELGALPPAVRAPAEAWIRQAQAQLAALAAARGLADGAIGALGKAAP